MASVLSGNIPALTVLLLAGDYFPVVDVITDLSFT